MCTREKQVHGKHAAGLVWVAVNKRLRCAGGRAVAGPHGACPGGRRTPTSAVRPAGPHQCAQASLASGSLQQASYASFQLPSPCEPPPPTAQVGAEHGGMLCPRQRAALRRRAWAGSAGKAGPSLAAASAATVGSRFCAAPSMRCTRQCRGKQGGGWCGGLLLVPFLWSRQVCICSNTANSCVHV
jgi:hypothetical protein